jgi:hypothetical protein
VAQPAIAIDRLEAFEIALELSSEVAFNQETACRNRLDDLVELLGAQILRAGIGVDVGLFENLFRGARTDAVNVRQRRFDAFVARNVYSKESWHILALLRLTLPLLVTRVLADNADDVLTLHDAARFAKAFHGGSDFHDR